MIGRCLGGETPCSQPTIDARYMPKVSNHAQFEEMCVLCSFQYLAGPCGVQTRING